MLIYFVNLIIVVFATYNACKVKSTTLSRCLYGIAFASMVLVAGLRDSRIGTDTGNYVGIFNTTKTFADAIKLALGSNEYAYSFLNWLLHYISDQYTVLLIAIAAIVVGCYLRVITKYSTNATISNFVLITMGFYTFFFNGARQGIACAVYALAIGPLLERNSKKYFGYVLLSVLFHKSALITLPVYFIFKKDNTIKTNLLILLIGCAGVFFFQNIFSVVSQADLRYSSYGTSGTGGGYLTVAFICALCLFFLGFKKSVQVDKDSYGLFLNMLIFGAMISVVPTLLGVNPSGILRLNLYFNISAVFLWPIVYKNLTGRSTRILYTYLFVVGYLAYFTLTTQKFSNLVPYVFNTTLQFL